MENERTCVDLRVRRESEELHYRHAPWYMEDGSTFSPLFYLCPSSYADCGWHQEGPEAGLRRPAPIHDTQASSYSFTIYTRFLLLFFSFWKISFLNLFFFFFFQESEFGYGSVSRHRHRKKPVTLNGWRSPQDTGHHTRATTNEFSYTIVHQTHKDFFKKCTLQPVFPFLLSVL
jgi:hypothetical protein